MKGPETHINVGVERWSEMRTSEVHLLAAVRGRRTARRECASETGSQGARSAEVTCARRRGAGYVTLTPFRKAGR
jgi:hypothetical protein